MMNSALFISGQALHRNMAESLKLTEGIAHLVVASSFESRRIQGSRFDLCFIDLTKAIELNDLSRSLDFMSAEKLFVFHTSEQREEIRLAKKDNLYIEYIDVGALKNFQKILQSTLFKLRERNNDYLLDTLKINESISNNFNLNADVILMGASTGGPEIIKYLLTDLPYEMPPIVIILHMDPIILDGFCKRIGTVSNKKVVSVKAETFLDKNCIYVGCGKRNIELKCERGRFYITSGSEVKVNGHCPSVDVLFSSAAKITSKSIAAFLLTGMGKDGAEGLLQLMNAGAITVAQDQNSSAVFGMAEAALNLKAVKYLLNPSDMHKLLCSQI